MMKPLAGVAMFLLVTVQSSLPPHPALVTTCIAEQLSTGLDNVKLCLECFEAIEDPVSEDGVAVMKVASHD